MGSFSMQCEETTKCKASPLTLHGRYPVYVSPRIEHNEITGNQIKHMLVEATFERVSIEETRG